MLVNPNGISFPIWPQILNRSDSKKGQQQTPNLKPTYEKEISNGIVTCNPKLTSLSHIVISSIPMSSSVIKCGLFSVDSTVLVPNKQILSASTKPTLKYSMKKIKIHQQQDMYKDYKKKKNQLQSFCSVCKIECGSSDLLKEHEESDGFMCRICTLEIKSHADLEAHFFNHKLFKCSLCHEFFIIKKELLFHKKIDHPSSGFSCEMCNRNFTRKQSLKIHKLQRHSNSTHLYKCVVCEKSFVTNRQMKIHLKRTHTVYEFLNCKVCHRLCLGPDNLKRHVKLVHLENSPVRCETCGKIFATGANLTIHMLTHDETERLCEVCGVSIRGKTAMKSHTIRFHSEKGTFSCKICNQQFELEIKCKQHYNRCKNKGAAPVPVFCEICGKQYKNSVVLKHHRLIHSDERPFKCELCGATFKQNVALRTHRRVHSNIDKYCCNGCGIFFRWKQTFDKHVIPNGISFPIWPQILNRSDSKTGQQQTPNLVPSYEKVISNGAVTCNPKMMSLSHIVISSFPTTSSDVTCNLFSVDPTVLVSNKQNVSNSNKAILKNSTKKTKLYQEQDMYDDYKKKKNKQQSFCLVCKIECGSSDLLKEHEENERFMCRICTLEIKSHADLEAHFFTHKPFRCNVCQEVFMSKHEVTVHKRLDHPSFGFRCDICNQKYTKKYVLRKHKLERHSDSSIHYKCVVCEKTFKTNSQLQIHLTSVHIAYEFLNCKFCHTTYQGPERLKDHVKSVHIENSPVRCDVCGKVFKNTYTLSKHTLTHDVTETLCQLCGVSIKNSVLKYHMIRVHSEKGKFFCKICNKQFELNIKCKQHYKRCKNKEAAPAPVFCEICGKQYKNWSILKHHKVVHSDERPYKCDVCGATFKQLVVLRTHKRVHSNDDKYCCNRCGISFRWKQTFDKHVNKCTVSKSDKH